MNKEKYVVSELPQSLRDKIRLFKKFPWVKKCIILRKYVDDNVEQRKTVKFIGEFVGQELIDYINSEYVKSYQKHIARNAKYIQKQLKVKIQKRPKK